MGVLTRATAPTGVEEQPISRVQWVDRNVLHANGYNPNHVAPPELALLKVSLLEDGWTQPIVVHPDESGFEIVDGFHRWLVSDHADIRALTDSLVPIVVLERDEAGQRMATIRHNRARGKHYVVRMADIVAELVQRGVGLDDIERGLGMDDEEVERLLERGVMVKRGHDGTLNESWRPA